MGRTLDPFRLHYNRNPADAADGRGESELAKGKPDLDGSLTQLTSLVCPIANCTEHGCEAVHSASPERPGPIQESDLDRLNSFIAAFCTVGNVTGIPQAKRKSNL